AVRRGTAGVEDAAGASPDGATGAAACGTEGMLASAPTAAGTACGTVLPAATGDSAGGADCSRFHSIHSKVATISQAMIRNTRVWFMGRQADRLGRRRMTGRERW